MPKKTLIKCHNEAHKNKVELNKDSTQDMKRKFNKP